MSPRARQRAPRGPGRPEEARPGAEVIERQWWPLQPSAAAGPARRVSRGAPTAKKPPIDPLAGPKIALAGRVVTMDARDRVLKHAVVYVDQGGIVDIRERAEAAPDGFQDTPVVETRGTIFPGLIELHNHLSYDALPLWSPIPKQFTHRGQWPDQADYRRLISGPMRVVGGTPDLLPALVRYVECKCLLAGVTTSQGIKLSSNAGVQRFYRGLVRNVEQTHEPDLPQADARIPDVDAKDAAAFRARMIRDQGRRCCLLHLSEGVTDPHRPDSAARRHFLALEVKPDDWAITDALAGIHATGLLAKDFDVLAKKGASVVWSPLSNLLLYGATSRVEAARSEGVKIGIGSDWSPTGSKNLLGELKAAWLYSEHFLREPFRARDIVAMATRTAAAILKWDRVLGSLEAGKRADLLLIGGTGGDPYESLIRATESSVRLVMINGVARYGVSELMDQLAPGGHTVRVGGEPRKLFLEQATADPDVRAVSLSAARDTLAHALRDLRRLAKNLERPKAVRAPARFAADRPGPVVWTLALDETCETGASVRPRLPYLGPRDFTGPRSVAPSAAASAAPLSGILGPIALDPLTVVDDADYLPRIKAQPNLPEEVKRGLAQLY